jgi:hypothetical protein
MKHAPARQYSGCLLEALDAPFEAYESIHGGTQPMRVYVLIKSGIVYYAIDGETRFLFKVPLC